jgi:hypothetical protein
MEERGVALLEVGSWRIVLYDEFPRSHGSLYMSVGQAQINLHRYPCLPPLQGSQMQYVGPCCSVSKSSKRLAEQGGEVRVEDYGACMVGHLLTFKLE